MCALYLLLFVIYVVGVWVWGLCLCFQTTHSYANDAKRNITKQQPTRKVSLFGLGVCFVMCRYVTYFVLVVSLFVSLFCGVVCFVFRCLGVVCCICVVIKSFICVTICFANYDHNDETHHTPQQPPTPPNNHPHPPTTPRNTTSKYHKQR